MPDKSCLLANVFLSRSSEALKPDGLKEHQKNILYKRNLSIRMAQLSFPKINYF